MYWITRVNLANRRWLETGSGYIANRDMAEFASELGFRHLNYFIYDVNTDSDEALNARLDGILSPLSAGDVVVVQFPTWQSVRFEQRFMDKLLAKKYIKTVLVIWDVKPWLHDGSDRDFTREYAFRVMNQCDLVVSPNAKMSTRLIQEGGVRTPLINTGLWDFVYNGSMQNKTFKKCLTFVGTLDKTDFSTYHGKTMMNLIGNPDGLTAMEKAQDNLNILGEMRSQDIIPLLDGGFGVVSYSNQKNETAKKRFAGAEKYGKYNNPLKLSLYLAAGLPVIVNYDSAHSELVQKENLGLVVDDLNEVEHIISSMTDDDYAFMAEKCRRYSSLLRQGFFTKNMLMKVIDYLVFGREDVLHSEEK
jgi:glycosyltransferase involved in cell wall biosynthesis